METCVRCGESTKLAYQCSRCGHSFCVEHRRPEDHDCPKLEDPSDSEKIMSRGHNTARDRSDGFEVGRNESTVSRAKAKITGVLGRSTDSAEDDGDTSGPDCAVCHSELEDAAFRCRYCRSDHCEEHRLPEDHYCPDVDWSAEFEDRYSDLFEEPVTPRSTREERERWWQEHEDGLPYEGRRI